jgi:ribosome maturation factor RimP
MDLNKLQDLIESVMNKKDDLFLLDYDISNENDIKLIIDGDRPVNIDDCKNVNRAIEKHLDELDIDASVQVTSPGVDEPLKVKRQYLKNIGRKLSVKTRDESYKASLENVNEDGIELNWKSREKKANGKGKVTINKNKTIAFDEIEQAIVMINFNKK